MKLQIPIGQTKHGQQLELHGEQKDGGEVLFHLVKLAAGQRDQQDVIRDVPPKSLDLLLRAVVKMREVFKA